MPYIQKELLIGCQRSHPSQRFCQIILTRLLSYSLKILKSCHVSSNPWNFVLLLIDIIPLGGGCSHDCKYRPNCPQLHRIESSMWFREVLNLLPVSGFATSVCKTTRVCNIFREIRFGWKSLVRVGKTSEWGGNLLSDVIVARLKQRRPVLQKQRKEMQYSGTIYISYS